MSYNCDQRKEDDEAPDTQPEANDAQSGANDAQSGATDAQPEAPKENALEDIREDIRPDNDHLENENPDSRTEEMDYDERAQGLKRQHVTDSDSDGRASSFIDPEKREKDC